MENIIYKFKEKNLFKLVLGLGNLDFKEIEYIINIYSNTKTDIIDIPPNQKAIDIVFKELKNNNKNINDFLFSLSFAIENDKHNSFAFINNEKCKKCFKCIKQCHHKAIFIKDKNVVIDKTKCIGCQKCKCKAISYKNKYSVSDFDAINLANKNNVKIIELHASISKTKMIKQTFDNLNNNFDGIISVCFSREYLSEHKLIKLTDYFIKKREGKPLIIQADGFSMTGGENDYSSTINAVSCAQLFQKYLKFQNFYIFISGGTNEMTSQLAKLSNIQYAGITVGSYARRIIKNVPYKIAIENANRLVNKCKH